MRIGYYGGTFDPPHEGHLAVARAARDRFSLDRVLLAPTGKQPLKASAAHASFAQRMDMVRLLCAGEDALEASDMDAPRADGSANYTIDAVHALKRDGDAVFCIVGADSFLDIRRWRDPDALLNEAQWIVASRPEFSLGDLSSLKLTEEQRERVHLLTDIHVDISATNIRAALAAGQTDVLGLPEAIHRYAREHHLYVKENDRE